MSVRHDQRKSYKHTVDHGAGIIEHRNHTAVFLPFIQTATTRAHFISLAVKLSHQRRVAGAKVLGQQSEVLCGKGSNAFLIDFRYNVAFPRSTSRLGGSSFI